MHDDETKILARGQTTGSPMSSRTASQDGGRQKARDEGGPAFPQPMRPDDPDAPPDEKGMALRDYFAGQALAGLVNTEPVSDREETNAPVRQIARDAYRIADAMLNERAKAEGR